MIYLGIKIYNDFRTLRKIYAISIIQFFSFSQDDGDHKDDNIIFYTKFLMMTY